MSYNGRVQPQPPRLVPAGLFGGEAFTLWRLRRGPASISCFVAEWPGAFWIAVECAGGALLSSETLPSVEAVLAAADQARSTWNGQGWIEE